MSTTSVTPVGTDGPGHSGPVVSIQNVTMRFGMHTVLKDISFDVPRGQISAVLGPSGTGKSVLLKVIIGLLRPQSGQVFVDGEPMVGVREKEVLRIRRKFGVLFQDGALFGSMNLFDNIAFPLVEHTQKTDKAIHDLVMERAELVGLVSHLKKLPGEVSGGMRKRAGLARALMLDPEIVFFDEPDSGLDPVRVAHLDRLVKVVQAETRSTFFIISHNIESIKRTADNMGLLFRSGLVAFGPAEQMLHSSNPVISQFLQGAPDGPIGMDEMADATTEPVAPRHASVDDRPASAEERQAPSPSPSMVSDVDQEYDDHLLEDLAPHQLRGGQQVGDAAAEPPRHADQQARG